MFRIHSRAILSLIQTTEDKTDFSNNEVYSSLRTRAVREGIINKDNQREVNVGMLKRGHLVAMLSNDGDKIPHSRPSQSYEAA
jgi:hypothetical protein